MNTRTKLATFAAVGVMGAAALTLAAPANATTLSPSAASAAKADGPGKDGYATARQRTTPYVMSPQKAAWVKAQASKRSRNLCSPDIGCPNAASGSVAQTQQGQIANNYCGPATLVETLAQAGRHPGDQNWAAHQLGTGAPGGSGTGSSTILATVLNAQLAGVAHYDTVYVNSPYSNFVADYESRLKIDIQGGYGLAAVAEEVHNGPHLNGHPNNAATIYHFFNIRGYTGSGAYTMYEDSANTVWSSVPAYSSISSDTLVRIISGRQYYW
jgi:hypothetical protein